MLNLQEIQRDFERNYIHYVENKTQLLTHLAETKGDKISAFAFKYEVSKDKYLNRKSIILDTLAHVLVLDVPRTEAMEQVDKALEKAKEKYIEK